MCTKAICNLLNTLQRGFLIQSKLQASYRAMQKYYIQN